MLLEFRKTTVIAEVQRATGLDWRTVRRAWETGWPRLAKAEPAGSYRWQPIREVLSDDAVKARARAHLLQQGTQFGPQEQAMTEELMDQEYSVRVRTKEAVLTREVRDQAVTMLEGTKKIIQMGDTIAATVRLLMGEELTRLRAWSQHEQALARGERPAAPPIPRPKMGLSDYILCLRRVATYWHEVLIGAKEALVMERLFLGQPAVMPEDGRVPDDLTLEEADRRVQAAAEALAAIRESCGRAAEMTGERVTGGNGAGHATN